jgi:DNA-binding MarR family transcriptional regulator
MAKRKKIDQSQDQLLFDTPERLLLDSLILTHDSVVGRFQELLRGFDVSYTQYCVLRILADEGDEGMRTQKLGVRLLTRVPDITRLVDRLLKTGLVKRKRWKDDKRVVFVSVTKAGRELLDEIEGPMAELQSATFDHLSENKQVELNRLLGELRKG